MNIRSSLYSAEIKVDLRGKDTHDRFSGETTFLTCLLSSTPILLGKGVYSERKELAPCGADYFLLEQNPVDESEKHLQMYHRVASHAFVSVVHNPSLIAHLGRRDILQFVSFNYSGDSAC